MGGDFPVPRSQLPRIAVTPQEYAARRAQMERILMQALDDYDTFRDVDKGHMNPTTWKLVATKERAKLYRECHVGSGVSTNSLAPTSSHSGSDNSVEHDDDGADFDLAACDESSSQTAGGGEFKRRLKSMRMVGELTGYMENAVFAVQTKNQEELAMVNMYLHESVADTQLLCTMEGPTREQPFHFLGYKWFVKRSPGGGRFVKHRDTVYLERQGIIKNKRGEDVGFLLIESVDVPGFPELPERNCVRSLQSVQFLVRQKSDNIVELFMTAVVEPAGRILRPLTTILTADTVMAVTKVMGLAETRRLTKMIVAHRQAREEQLFNGKNKSAACALCHQRSHFFNTTSLLDCNVCGQQVCNRCWTYKHLFVSERLLGRLHRIECCKTCVIAANRARPASSRTPVHVNPASQFYVARMTNSIGSRPRSSSDSSVVEALPVWLPLADDGDVLVKKSLAVRYKDDSIGGPSITHLPSGASISGSVRGAQPFDRRRGDLVAAGAALPIARSVSATEPRASTSIPVGLQDMERVNLPPTTESTTTNTTAASSASTHEAFLAKMMELRRVAEDTYYTTRQNHLFMEQGAQAPRQQQQSTPGRVPARHLY